MAALKNLPMLVVIEDNGYSTYSNKKLRWPANKNVKSTIEGMGMNYYSGLGDDVEEIYAQFSNIISEVRNNIPSVVHLDTFRRYEHCGPNLDDNLGYRKTEEINSYNSRDPLEILGNKMISSGVSSEILLKKLVSQINSFTEEIYKNMLQQNKSYLEQFEMN